jgi:NADH-quinone oxidoreductase subunit F
VPLNSNRAFQRRRHDSINAVLPLAQPIPYCVTRGERLIGCWASLASPIVTELLGIVGFDWMLLDAEHAPNDVLTLIPQLMALKDSAAAPVVRPPANDSVVIKRLLDAGFFNFLIPFVDSVADAQRAVAATRYPPLGIRGVSVGQRGNRYGTVADYFEKANDNICVVLQIESRAAVQAIDEIAAVEGVDAVFVGPSDLAAAYRHIGNASHPDGNKQLRTFLRVQTLPANHAEFSRRCRQTRNGICRWEAPSSPCAPTWVFSVMRRRRSGITSLKNSEHEPHHLLHLERHMKKAGFIGLGIMGSPMAANLLKHGVELAAFTLGGVPKELTGAGAIVCDSPGAVTADAEVISLWFRIRRTSSACCSARTASTTMDKLNQVLLRDDFRVGADLDAWLAREGGAGLARALEDPDAIIAEIAAADLRGMGGAGFATHRKWTPVAAAADGNKYIICNGNEDEPATFKDRVLLEHTPHQVIEGALIAAVATRANHVVIYVNPHQEGALAATREAVPQCQTHPLFAAIEQTVGGAVLLGVVPSSGLYIGGEETAVIASVQGGFPFPRRKPPFPAEEGVHGAPTVVNNAETLAHVPGIMRHGAQWYRDLGIGDAAGTKLYSLSGDVLHPGLYELPMGTSLQSLVFDLGGGMLQGKQFKAVFTGGPSNTLLTKRDLDVALDFDSVRERRSRLGTGAMIVVSEGTSIVRKVAVQGRHLPVDAVA